MAAAGKWKAYDELKARMGDGTIDLNTNPLKLAIFLSTSNANTLSVGTGVYGDLTNEHANANGYLTGGVALASVTYDNTGATATFDAADLAPAWTAAGGAITGRFGVIYVNATVNTIVKPLVGVCLLDATPADVTAADGNPFNITFNVSGIFTLTGATAD